MLPRNNKNKGYSLLELLIAMSVGFFVIGSVLAFFVSANHLQKVQHETSVLRENADFALTTIIEDIQLAGFMGCATRWSSTKMFNTLNNPNGFEWNFAVALQGNEYKFDEVGNSGSWLPVLDPSITSPLRGDVITIRRADRREFNVVSHASSTATIQTDGNNFKEDDFILVTDCETSSIFQKTNSNYTQGIKHELTAATPSNLTTDLGKAYSDEAKLMKLTTLSYYIRDKDGIPALYRKAEGGNAEEIISGIESLNITYGVDHNNDFSVDEYLTADAVDNAGQWHQVLVVNVELLARSLSDNVTANRNAVDYFFDGAIQTPDDAYLRTVVSAKVTLRNRML
ncbi:MAG: PilW family protein [bacterium]